jgi:hypothetical protein
MTQHVVRGERPPRRVERVGDTVHRPAYPWTPAVHALLRHLESVGFPYSPRVLGFDEQGREVLTFIDGESGPAAWTRVVGENGLRSYARLLRDYHRAVAGWRRDPDLLWSSGIQEPAGQEPEQDPEREVVCHGDFGPWNLVWRGEEPVGILDWDFAYPAPARRDVVYAAEYAAPFRSDAECRSLGFPVPPDRRRRLEVFAEAYGLSSTAGLADDVNRTQRETLVTVRRLARAGCQPQATWAAQGFLDLLEQRIRWIEDDSGLLVA